MRYREPQEPTCRICDDLGILLMIQDTINVFGRCSCKTGEWQPWKLPVARKVLDYRVSRVPHEIFKPDIKIYKVGMPQSELKKAIEEKAQWWRETIRISEEYWQHNLENENSLGRNL